MPNTKTEHKLSALREKTDNRLPEPVYRFFETWNQEFSFITLHYLYFITTCLIASLIFWGSSSPARSISYVDSLFLVISAMTLAGLNTVNLSQINTFQQFILFLLIMMGSAIFVSCGVIFIRKRAFENRFESLAEERASRMKRSRTFFSFPSRSKTATGTQMADVTTHHTVQKRMIPSEAEDSGRSEDNQGVKTELGHDQDQDQDRSRSPLPPLNTSVAAQRDVGSPEDETEMPAGMLKTDTVTSNDRGVKFEDGLMTRARAMTADSAGTAMGIKRSNTQKKLFSGVGARGLDNHPKLDQPIPLTPYPSHTPSTQSSGPAPRTETLAAIDKYLKASDGRVGRNSQFYHLTPKERKMLGGIEYDAIRLLSWVVPTYFILWQLFGAIGLGAWIQINRPITATANGLNPFWTGAFFAISAFGNSGMALLDANASAFQTSYYVLLTMGLLILAGNTCFPPFLRLILWSMKKLIPKSYDSPAWQQRRTVLNFILEHPRRVYTNLFPAQQNWWLVFSLVMLNGIDWIAFEVLNIGNPVTNAIPGHFRALDGLFQALAVRCGGFYVVNIAGLRSGLLVLYLLMMYVSALPVTMTIRNTNVYEERSLAIYSDDLPSHYAKVMGPSSPTHLIGNLKRRLTARSNEKQQKTWERGDFLRQQLRGQLGHDLWFIALAVLFITIIETGQFERDPVVFSTFNILFETVSAYGTVGLSTGVPWNNYSFCGAWHAGSKLILMAVMLRGRHRGLPVAIDSAIVLPTEALAWAEERDARKRTLTRRRTNLDMNDADYNV